MNRYAPANKSMCDSMTSKHSAILHLIWLYFFFLIFEGALRKWVIPSLADPILIIRDPIVIAIYCLSIQQRIISLNNYIIAGIFLAILSFIFTIFAQYSYFWVLIYGLRTDFLHVPLIFIMPKILERTDIEKMGRWVLYIVIPMTLLIFMQFNESQNAWVNKQIGGKEISRSLIGAAGKFRPSGTFSFANGIACFYSLATAFVLYFILEKKTRKPWWMLVAGGSILLAMPLTISRITVISCAITLFTCIFVIYKIGIKNSRLGRLIIIGTLIAIVVPILPIFDTGKKVFNERWTVSTTQAGGFKNALVDRYIDSMKTPLLTLFNAPLFGYGVGVGTNVGAKLILGKRAFLLGEVEWGRVVYEMGPFLGLAFIIYRLAIAWMLFKCSWSALSRHDGLPFLLFSATVLVMINGQWAQPTILGFSIFGAGLTLSAAYRPSSKHL